MVCWPSAESGSQTLRSSCPLVGHPSSAYCHDAQFNKPPICLQVAGLDRTADCPYQCKPFYQELCSVLKFRPHLRRSLACCCMNTTNVLSACSVYVHAITNVLPRVWIVASFLYRVSFSEDEPVVVSLRSRTCTPRTIRQSSILVQFE